MKRFFSYLLLIGFSGGLIFCSVGVSEATPKKRVAVLYFEDSSRFDSSTGCGCVPGFIGAIFGTKKRWDLEAGFAKMLNRKLIETNVYEPVSTDELLDAMAMMTLSRHSLKKLDQSERATLAKHLNADVIVIGDIRHFNQERLRTNASRTLREGGREAPQGIASYTAPVIVRGSIHRATIKLNMKFYNASGETIAEPRIAVTRDHSYAGTRFASLEASVTEEGTNVTFGQTSEKRRRNPRPIVKPTELNKIKFATTQTDWDNQSDEDKSRHPHHYDETLLGMVTNEVLIEVVLALRDNVGPKFITPWEPKPEIAEKGKKTPSTAADGPIKGQILYVDPDIIYVNIGSDKGIAINQEFTVYTKGKPVRDIDTGEILTYVPKKIGTLAVAEIQTNKVSIFRVVEIAEPLKRGDVVSEVTPETLTSEEQE